MLWVARSQDNSRKKSGGTLNVEQCNTLSGAKND